MIKHIIMIIATLGLFSVIASAEFSETSCMGCHGSNFEKAAMGHAKVLTTMTAEEITTALNGYKDGTYGGVMKKLMKAQAISMSEDDIEEFSDKYGKK